MARRYGWRSVATFGLAVVLLLTGLSGCTSTSSGDAGVVSGPRSRNLERAVSFLLMYARNPDKDIRANCIEALEPLQDGRVSGAIEQGLRDREGAVRFAACLAAGRHPDVKLKPGLEALYRTETNGSVRVGIIFALRRMGDTSRMNRLTAALTSPDPVVRANTAMIFGMLGEPSARGLLNQQTKDKDVRANHEITAALARLGDRPAQDVVIGLSLSKFTEDHFFALAVCADIDRPEVHNILLTAIHDPDAPNSEEGKFNSARTALLAARSLAKLGSVQGGKLTLSYMNHPRPEIRSLAAFALGDLLLPNEEAPLVKLMDDPDLHVQIAACAGLVSVWSRAETAATQPFKPTPSAIQ